MPIYEFRCEMCGEVFESLQRIDEDYPPCPKCGSLEVMKLPSIFGFQDRISQKSQRELSILKRARDYLIDGKVGEARRFLEKAKEFHPSDRVKKLSDLLSERKAVRTGYISKTEYVITKKKEKG